MYAAVGIVRHVQENEQREVTDAELVRVVFIEAATPNSLYEKMCEQELEVRKVADVEMMRAELEESEQVVYPTLNWERVYSVDSTVNVLSAIENVHKSDNWRSYERFGAVMAREAVINSLREEATHRLELMDALAAEPIERANRLTA